MIEKVNNIPAIEEKEILSFLNLYGFSEINENEKKQFIQICMMNGLNPFKREAYITAYGKGQYRKFSILVGYEVYIKRAEMSGRLDGWEVTTTGKVKDNSLKAIITIYRKDFSRPFVHEVYYAEYVQRTKEGKPNKFWHEKPVTMTKKVAISQGFRMCFNEVLGGLPYTTDEMPNEVVNIDNIQPKEEKEEPKQETKVIDNRVDLIKDSDNWSRVVDYIFSGGNCSDLRKKYKNITEILELEIKKEVDEIKKEQLEEEAYKEAQDELNKQ